MPCHQNVNTLVSIGLIVLLQACTQSVDDPIALAVAPLPEELRAGATVFTYDPDTGERIVMREGTNQIECQPQNADGYTLCNSFSESTRNDLHAKLRAQGMSDEERQAAVADAEIKGLVKPRVFGSMTYRLHDSPQVVQLLWIVSLPYATSLELGLPVQDQKDNSIAGKGAPWMMNEGTSEAHLMIPVNRSSLSN